MQSKRPETVPSDEIDFRSATRRVLFDSTTVRDSVPGGGTSATESSGRHIRLKVTMNLDGDIVQHFKDEAKRQGRAYQLLINQALREDPEGDRPEQLAKKVSTVLLDDEQFVARLAEKVRDLGAK